MADIPHILERLADPGNIASSSGTANIILRRLPHELRLLVASYLVQRWCAVSTAGIQITEPKTASIDLSSSIWATFVKMYGRIYVAALTNTQPEARPNRLHVLVHKPTSTNTMTAIYLGRDPWGVRRISFMNSEAKTPFTSEKAITTSSIGHTATSHSQSIWWRTRCFTEQERFVVETDVLCLSNKLHGKPSTRTDTDVPCIGCQDATCATFYRI